MELWNDYEGKLLDGQFRLERLIGPKGRSAFFTTLCSDGTLATVRVIESLNDEDEILARWNSVREMDEPTLVRILACNKTILDGVHLVYAVLESTDAELADLLRDRPLSPDEARQMASTVITALEALHGKGLIHEHVEAESVLAKGEDVKLRGDCVREAPEGPEGDTLRRRDAHDLAMLVGYALTQRRDVGQAKLPRPFDELVRNGMSGMWGLREMAAVVRPVATSTTTPVPSPQKAAPVATAPLASSSKPLEEKTVTAVADTTPAGLKEAAGPRVPPARAVAPAAAAGGEAAGGNLTSAQAVAASLGGASQLPTRRSAAEDRILLEPEEDTKSRGVFWAGLAVVAILLVSLIWHFTHVSEAKPTTSAPAVAAARTTESAPVATPVVTAKPSAAKSSVVADSRVPVGRGAGPAGSQWRVVAYTFNREEAAQKKAQTIAQSHPELKPEVFTPSGRPPYLVALGGWMSVEQARAFKLAAARDGLPRDMYTQNFKGH